MPPLWFEICSEEIHGLETIQLSETHIISEEP